MLPARRLIGREAAAMRQHDLEFGEAIHDTAEKQAGDGDHSAAIKTLQEGTKRLQTALRTIGVEVPE